MTIGVTPGTGKTVQTDTIGGTEYQQIKINLGATGVDGGLVTTSNPLPVTSTAGTAIIGKVTTDQTTHGTTDLVAADITKVAGSAIAQGNGTAATAIRVALPTDGTGVVGLIAGSAIVGKVGIDQTTLGTTNRVVSNTSPLIVAGSAMTRVADTNIYASGDFIGNNVTAASCTIANSGFTIAIARGTDITGRLTGALLETSSTTTTAAIFRAHVFNVNPLASAPNAGDNGVFQMASSTGYLGYIDFSMTALPFTAGNKCRGVFGIGPFMNFAPVTGTSNLYAVLECRGAYTPASAQTFTLTFEAE